MLIYAQLVPVDSQSAHQEFACPVWLTAECVQELLKQSVFHVVLASICPLLTHVWLAAPTA